jgi:hypothetical protein
MKAATATARSADYDAVEEDTARAVASCWIEDARMEHASVAAFARFALELISLGAPMEMVAAAQIAMGDELRHTGACLDMARRWGVRGEFGPMDLRSLSVGTITLEDVVVRAIREGCIGETVATMIVAEAAEAAVDDPTARQLLQSIAADEARHAELAWRFVTWALEADATLIDVVRSTFCHASSFADSPRDDAPDGRGARFGRLCQEERARVAARAIREVITPCAEAMLRHVSARAQHDPLVEARTMLQHRRQRTIA